jgi:hypothetical protein
MKTDLPTEPTAAVFPQIVSAAVNRLKQQLQQDYEQAYPSLREIIHLVLDEEETKARELSGFPHLLLPDLVEAHVANLNLSPAKTKRDNLLVADDVNANYFRRPLLALCGT